MDCMCGVFVKGGLTKAGQLVISSAVMPRNWRMKSLLLLATAFGFTMEVEALSTPDRTGQQIVPEREANETSALLRLPVATSRVQSRKLLSPPCPTGRFPRS